MQSEIKLSHASQDLLRCPCCHSKLKSVSQSMTCENSECLIDFPVVDNIPILINDQLSIFTIDDFVSNRDGYYKVKENKLTNILLSLVPNINNNIKSNTNFKRLSDELLHRSTSPRVLIIGSNVVGQGMEPIMDNPAIELIESDVALGEHVSLLFDAHDIPFEDTSFDGVIIQAVLEHVVDPYRCCEEIHRVLKDDGVVYAETPFIQQVHANRYDFTRFTHLGHRRLFRRFTEIDSGAACGPGMALAWSYQYFLRSFATSKAARGLLRVFGSFTSFYLKYFDYLLIDKPGALDASSSCYFMGEKSDQTLSDKDLIKLFRGLPS
jgi:SAM-dependent methyltransferase